MGLPAYASITDNPLGREEPPADDPVGPQPGPEEPHRCRRGQRRRSRSPGNRDRPGSAAHVAQTGRGANQQLLQHWYVVHFLDSHNI